MRTLRRLLQSFGMANTYIFKVDRQKLKGSVTMAVGVAVMVAVMVRSRLMRVVVPISDPCPKVNIYPEINTIIRFSQAFETPF